MNDCPHYPCSIYGDNCKYCYCPFYNRFCYDESIGGNFIETKNGYKIWDCSNCKIIHRDDIVLLIDLDINENNLEKIKEKWLKIINKMILENKKNK